MAGFLQVLDTNDTPYWTTTTAHTGVKILGDADASAISTWRVHVKKNTSTTMSFVFKGRARGSDLASADWISLPYQKVDAATIDIAAGTAVTVASIYLVRADGMDLIIDLTANDGEPILYAAPFIG